MAARRGRPRGQWSPAKAMGEIEERKDERTEEGKETTKSQQKIYPEVLVNFAIKGNLGRIRNKRKTAIFLSKCSSCL